MSFINDLKQPDKWDHFKKTIRRYKQDITNRLQRVDIQALALDWQVTGVDISYWQGEITNPAKLAEMVDFVFIRAGYGNDYKDPRMEHYVQICKEYDIPYGLYWYTKPDKSFEKHADNFYLIWNSKPGKIYPVFDLEERGRKNKTDLESWYKKLYDRFNAKVPQEYKKDITYTSPGFLNSAIGITNWLKHTLLMVAHWTTRDYPIIPNEWAVPGFTWKFWQWSSTGKGSDYGVSSKYIDLQRYNGTKSQFYAEFGITPTPPPPPPDPEPGIVPLFQVTPLDQYDWVNLRAGPGVEYADIGDARKLSVLPVVSEDGDAYEIRAYVSKSVVKKI